MDQQGPTRKEFDDLKFIVNNHKHQQFDQTKELEGVLTDSDIGTTVQTYDAELAQIAALADPNADRILFWDDSAGSYAHLTVGTGLSISGTTLTAESIANQDFTAGETLAANDALYVTDYPAVVPTFDAWNDFIDSSVTSSTNSFTVGNNSNRILIVAIATNAAQNVTGVTYAGDSLTNLLASTNDDSVYRYSIYYKLNPTTGANNLVITANASTTIRAQVSSYYNVAQQAPEASGSASAANLGTATVNLTNITNRAMMYFMISSRGNGSPSGTAYQNNIDTSWFYTGDSGEVSPIQSKSLSRQADNSGFPTVVRMYSLAAYTTYTAQRVYKTSASQAQTADSFIGFATGSATIGNSVTVTIMGVVSGFSSLVTGAKYYLSNTSGAISNAAGTVTRKVGLALSNAIINITNIW